MELAGLVTQARQGTGACLLEGPVGPALEAARLEPRLVHGPADRLAAAMDDDDPHAEGGQEDDVDEQVPQRVRVLDDTAAEFDHGGGVAELADRVGHLVQRRRIAAAEAIEVEHQRLHPVVGPRLIDRAQHVARAILARPLLA